MSHESHLPPQGGILLVDKAEGWTSHDVVAKTRGALRTRKVGHAGTLDPMATGLLMLGAGPATRLLTHLVGLDKVYTTTLRLGATTVTDDREGEVVAAADAQAVADVLRDPDRVRAAVAELTGAIEQAPSAVSAIKVDGRRAYDRVRAGEAVELQKRSVTVHRFELGQPRAAQGLGVDGVETDVIDIDAVIHCSSGTYVRALARDLGAALGIGGHLTALRRTEVGPFSVDDAVSTERIVDGDVGPLLLPSDVAARLFPVLRLTEQQAIDLGHGKRIDLEEGQNSEWAQPEAPLVAALSPDGRLIGLVKVKRGRARVVTNFPTPDAAATESGRR
ncbi:tRNA pseudouridine(55) synthase TruB [Leucobacter sp. GX24907]